MKKLSLTYTKISALVLCTLSCQATQQKGADPVTESIPKATERKHAKPPATPQRAPLSVTQAEVEPLPDGPVTAGGTGEASWPLSGALGVTRGGGRLTASDYAQMRELGIRHLRMELRWDSVVERERGKYHFESYVEDHAAMQAHGICPIYLLAYSNKLYDKDGFTMNEAAEQEAFAAFAAAAVARFDGPEVLWELGNEPETSKMWPARAGGNTEPAARERARHFMAMARAAIPAMRARSPEVKIISGGIIDPHWKVAKAWLEEAFSLGLLQLFDGVGVHGYGHPLLPTELRFSSGLQNLRQRILRHGGPADYPIYQTEFGVGLHNHDTSGPMPERLRQQAAGGIRMFLMTSWLGLQTNTYYQWRFSGKHHESGNERGILSPNGARRPLYHATKILSQQLRGYTFERRIELGTEQDFLFSFTGHKGRLWVGWTLGQPHTVNVPLPLPEPDGPTQAMQAMTTTDMLGHTRPLTARAGQVAIHLTEEPQYLGPSRRPPTLN